jgi:L-threonylcarbamoyladenylate synthase
VQNYFEDILPMILDGGTCHRGLESTILGFEDANPVLYRHGAIAVEDIEKEIGKISIKAKSDNAPLAPGMLKKHYSPKTKTILTDDLKSVLKQQNGRVGVLSFKDHYSGEHIIKNEILSPSGDLSQAASRLYSVLHILDELNLDVIIAEKMPDLGLGQSINDRLARAAE